MSSDFFRKNIAALRGKAPHIADELMRAATGTAYNGVQAAKTGAAVPILQSGQALHSLYRPEAEAERLIGGDAEGFMLFCGIGAGIHIRLFLDKYPHSHCAVTEADYASFRQLLHLLDYADIFAHPRVFVLPPCSHELFRAALVQTYLPALFGSFHCHMLRAWKLFFTRQTAPLVSDIEQSLAQIRGDYSVQAHFGKIWMRNIFLNLQTASAIRPAYPVVDTSRTALVLGAGPSLEHRLTQLHHDTTRYTLFCTDTAFPVVTGYGIVPDFFISIDPQQVSYAHILHRYSARTTGIFDISANAAAVRQFHAQRNAVFFVAGGHPLARYAASHSPFPFLDTSSGTVAIAAYYAAQSLGFKTIECTGMDFAYTDGKAYARGTYLSDQFAYAALRYAPEETAFTRLMFRTPSYTKRTETGLTYCTEVLDSYAQAFARKSEQTALWQASDFAPFPYRSFMQYVRTNILQHEEAACSAFLPYKAWHEQHSAVKKVNEELALDVLSEYTCLQ
ncbi:MAG: motility associated factor glycosyltransferase family protein [Treponema sp.]